MILSLAESREALREALAMANEEDMPGATDSSPPVSMDAIELPKSPELEPALAPRVPMSGRTVSSFASSSSLKLPSLAKLTGSLPGATAPGPAGPLPRPAAPTLTSPVPALVVPSASAPPLSPPAAPVPAPAKPMASPILSTAPMSNAPAAPVVTVLNSTSAPAGPPPTPSPPGSTAADPLTEAPNAVWYVRPPSGGQYGPAACDIMRAWLAEGRLSSDSLVWREGWRDWKEASEVFPQFNSPDSVPGLDKILAEQASTPLHTHHGESHAHGKRRPQRSSMMLIAIVVIVLILAGVAAVFLMPKESPTGGAPKTGTTGATKTSTGSGTPKTTTGGSASKAATSGTAPKAATGDSKSATGGTPKTATGTPDSKTGTNGR